MEEIPALFDNYYVRDVKSLQFALTFNLHKIFVFNHNAICLINYYGPIYISLCFRVVTTVAINQVTARPASRPNYPLYDKLADGKLMRAINRVAIIGRRSAVWRLAAHDLLPGYHFRPGWHNTSLHSHTSLVLIRRPCHSNTTILGRPT